MVEGLTLDQSEEQIAAALEVEDDEDDEDDRIVFYFDHPTLDYVLFTWDDDHPDEVSGFALYAFETNDGLAPIVARLGTALGPRFIKDAKNGSWTWRWAGAHIHVNDEMTVLVYNSAPDEDLDWKERRTLMWSVFLSAATERELDVSAEDLARLTGAGVTLADLAKLDVSVEIDGATNEVRTRFPAATVDQNINLEFELPVAHPWFGHAELEWRNEAEGKLQRAKLWPPMGVQEFPDQEAIRGCLEGTLGEPRTRVSNHMKGERTYDWELEGMGAIRLYDHILTLDPNSGRGFGDTSPPSQEAWSRVMSTLGTCGG